MLTRSQLLPIFILSYFNALSYHGSVGPSKEECVCDERESDEREMRESEVRKFH